MNRSQGSGIVFLVVIIALVCAIAGLYPFKYFFIGLALLIGFPLGFTIFFLGIVTYYIYRKKKKYKNYGNKLKNCKNVNIGDKN